MNIKLAIDSVKAGYSLIFGKGFFYYMGKCFLETPFDLIFVFGADFLLRLFVSSENMWKWHVFLAALVLVFMLPFFSYYRRIVRGDDKEVVSYENSFLLRAKLYLKTKIKEFSFQISCVFYLITYTLLFMFFIVIFSDLRSGDCECSKYHFFPDAFFQICILLIIYVFLLSSLRVFDVGLKNSMKLTDVWKLSYKNKANLFVIFALTLIPSFSFIYSIILYSEYYFHFRSIFFTLLWLFVLFLLWIPYVGAMVHFHKTIVGH